MSIAYFAMRIRGWELAIAVVGALLALLYLLAGSLFVGLGMAAAVVGWVASRVRPRERPGVAGGHARAHARLEAAQLIALIAGVGSIVGLLITAAVRHWSHTPPGFVAVLALSTLEVMLMIEGNRHADQLVNWRKGASTEEAVKGELETLPSDEWIVTHNWARDWGGNIDHIAVAATGAYAIETKSGRYRASDGAQAIGAAMALRELTGVPWVTAVVCIPGNEEPYAKGYVWVVGRERLAAWLRTSRLHRGRPIAIPDVRRLLETT